MKKSLRDYFGTVAFVLGCIALFYLPVWDDGIFPDPWETLFDWAGEIVAMSYLGVLTIFVRLAPLAALAGLLDRCDWQRGAFAIFLLVFTGVLIFYWRLNPLMGLGCGLSEAVLLGAVYGIARGLRAAVSSIVVRARLRS